MALNEILEKLATENNSPCVTISFNTHRTQPENLKDEIVLKNLLSEAEKRVIDEYGKRPVAALLEKIENLPAKIDHSRNLESMHIFLSNDTEEIVKTTWPVANDIAIVDETFAVRPLIKALNRTEEYLILALTQSGSRLYEAMNDSIVQEIREEGFPFPENPYYITHSDQRSDGKQVDNQIKEYFNQVDKSVVEVFKKTNLKVVVIATENNFAKLMEVADRPEIYIGHDNKNYNDSEDHHLVEQAYEIIREKQFEERGKAIEEVKEAVAAGKVITDLQEIYQAALDGRGDVLIVNQDFEQPVKMLNPRNFEFAEDAKAPGVVDDIVSNIAWEVQSKKGNVYFTRQEELEDLGKIVLKTRY